MELHPQAGVLRRAAGAARRVAARRPEAVAQRGHELLVGERLDRRRVAERQHRERLAPRDLAGLLTARDPRACGMSARRPPEFVIATCTPSSAYLSRIASATKLPIEDSRSRAGSSRSEVDRRAADDDVEQRRGVGGRLVDDRLHVGPLGDADVLGQARRRTRPLDVAVVDQQLRHRVADAGVEALDHGDAADDGVRRAVRVPRDHQVDGGVLQLVDDPDDRAVPRRRRAAVDRVRADVSRPRGSRPPARARPGRGASPTRAGSARPRRGTRGPRCCRA